MKRVHQKIERTEADRSRVAAIRERFQREKPGPKRLVESGEYNPPVPTAAYFAVGALLKQLRREREAAGLSLGDLADRTGIDRAALSRLETGKHMNPTVDTLARYAAALGKRVAFSVVGLADTPPLGNDARAREESNGTVDAPAGDQTRGRASRKKPAGKK